MEETKHTWLHQPVINRKCPKCNAGNLDTRIPRGFWVKYVLRLNLKRYKCMSCGAQVYVR